MIDLNSEDYNQKEGKAIFNEGNAGIVDNVRVSLVRRKPEDKETAPDYKVVFTDEKGAECNTSFWYVEKPTTYDTVEKLIQKQGKVLKHLAHAILGDNFKFPPFANAKEMLDGIMKSLNGGLAKAGTFRIFANYGTKDYPKSFIQPRSWVPFMESSTVALDATRLKPGNIDQMTRKEEDKVDVGTDAGNASTDDDGDDW